MPAVRLGRASFVVVVVVVVSLVPSLQRTLAIGKMNSWKDIGGGVHMWASQVQPEIDKTEDAFSRLSMTPRGVGVEHTFFAQCATGIGRC